MTGRTPSCESSTVGERMRELQRDRMAAIAGCNCPQRTTQGEVVHTSLCPLGPHPAAAMASPSQIEQVLAAVERLRLRAYRTRGMCRDNREPRGGSPSRISPRRRLRWAEPAGQPNVKMKRRALPARRFGEGESDAYTSPPPAPDYCDLALPGQGHPNLVAGRESGLEPGSFPRSRP